MKTDSKNSFHDNHEIEIELGLSKQFPKSPLYKYGVEIPLNITKKIAPYVAIIIISRAVEQKLYSILEPYIEIMINSQIIQDSRNQPDAISFYGDVDPNRIKDSYIDGLVYYTNSAKKQKCI